MRPQGMILLGVTSLALTSPTPNPQGVGGGADSCPSDALTPATWTNLKIDDFLARAAKDYTRTKTNNIQSLADSFGAPNFFCGLDNFCNAGQPCLPIQLPAWYAAVAIQNWNNYMNSLNTALTFASSILSLKLGEIVADVYPNPADNITPLKTIGSVLSAILSAIPFTGSISTARDMVNPGLAFILVRTKPPAPVDKFLAWSNVAGSMGDVVKEYQGIVSNSIKAIVDAEVDNPANGINGVIKGGGFLGVSQNFTQNDLQNAVIDSITMNSIGMALQAQKIFITRFFNRKACNKDEVANELCKANEGSNTFTLWTMVKRGSNSNADPQTNIAKVLLDKYKMTKEQLLKGPTDCYDTNGKKQLTNPFDAGGLPPDAKAPCVYNVLVCDIDVAAGNNKGIVDFCSGDFGLNI